MDAVEMNKRAVRLLEKWDPLEKGTKAYELEILEVVKELQQLDDPVDLAKKIREIYEGSYKIWVPIEKCVHIAYKLLALKFEAKNIV